MIPPLPSRGRLPGGLAALTASALLLSGCSGGSSPAPRPATVTSTYPVVVPGQAETILDSVDSALAQVMSTGTATALGPRQVGPLRAQLEVQLKLRAKQHNPPALVNVPFTRQRLLVPAQQGWPRWFLVVGSTTTLPTPVIRLLTSADARSPYGLAAQMVMLPGSTVPEIAPVSHGAPVLTPDAPGLLATPQQILADYADVLTKGTASASSGMFSNDLYRQQVAQKLAADQARFQKVGTVTSIRAPQPGSVLAMRTADGGALVIGQAIQTYTVTMKPNSGSVQVDPGLAALAGKAQFAHQVIRTSVEMFAFVVPAAGGSRQASLIAAMRADLSAGGT